jgi:thioredoxin 1
METKMTPEKESFKEIINGDTPVLVDFFAEWCGPCKLMKPVLQELHEKMGASVRIIKIDIDKTPGLSGSLQIQSVPTLLLFKKGEVLWRQSGVVPATQLEKIIRTYTV